MSDNPFTDGQQFSAARLNSMYNAHQNNGVLTGLDASTSTNSFDVAVSSGEVFLNGNVVSASSTTVTHSTSDPEDRIDLITVNSNGTISITQGSPAATSGEPVAPDIPADEVLAVLVYVRGGSAEILSGDIFNDYKVTLGDTPPTLISPQGAGSGLDADTVDGEDATALINPDSTGTVGSGNAVWSGRHEQSRSWENENYTNEEVNVSIAANCSGMEFSANVDFFNIEEFGIINADGSKDILETYTDTSESQSQSLTETFSPRMVDTAYVQVTRTSSTTSTDGSFTAKPRVVERSPHDHTI